MHWSPLLPILHSPMMFEALYLRVLQQMRYLFNLGKKSILPESGGNLNVCSGCQEASLALPATDT